MALRVLHVNDVAYTASNMVRALRQLGVEAELFQPTIGTYRSPKATRFMLPFIRSAEAFKLGRYVRYAKFDIVHVHYARFSYLPLLAGIPYYLHCHGGDLLNDMLRPGFRELTVLGIHKAKRVFCSTPDLLDPLRRIRPDGAFVPNPIDTDEFSPNSARISHSQGGLFSISKLDERKGIEEILRCAELIWEACPDTRIGFFGFGDVSQRARSFLDRNRHRPNLVVHGPVPHDQMPNLIKQYDVVLGQQLLGTLGMSELEAMACGNPVICDFRFEWAYPEPPPIVKSRSPEQAAAHAIRLLEDPELRRRDGERSREWVVKYHAIRNVAETLLSYYAN